MNVRDRLQEVLGECTTLTVHGLADRLTVNEETAAKLLREERVPMFVRAGILWVRGRKPRRPAPPWMKEEKA